MARRKGAPRTDQRRSQIRIVMCTSVGVRPQRLSSDSYRGRRCYFLTMRTFEGQPHFTNASVVDDVWFEFLQAAILNKFEILAYCFMHDHLHILVAGLTDDSNRK